MKPRRQDRQAFALGAAIPALIFFGLFGPRTATDDLCPELEILRPFVGTWTGEFQDATERPAIVRTWTPILGGQAIRETRTVSEAGFEAESIFYYDRKAGVVAYLGMTNNGYVSRGQFAFDGAVFTQSGEQTGPDASAHSIRVTFRFTEEGTLVNQLYNWENGGWRIGHSVVYTANGGV
jgi:hypothetical protein